MNDQIEDAFDAWADEAIPANDLPTTEQANAFRAGWGQGAAKAERERDEALSRLADYDERLSAAMPPDYKDWHKNARSEWPLVAAETIRGLRQRETDAQRERDEALEREAELREVLEDLDAATEHFEGEDAQDVENLFLVRMRVSAVLGPGEEE